MNKIEEFEHRMIKIFEKDIEETGDGYCKPHEPSITIGINNDLKWWCEIYSYRINYSEEGGRHHLFEANNYGELIEKVDEAISRWELPQDAKNAPNNSQVDKSKNGLEDPRPLPDTSQQIKEQIDKDYARPKQGETK